MTFRTNRFRTKRPNLSFFSFFFRTFVNFQLLCLTQFVYFQPTAELHTQNCGIPLTVTHALTSKICITTMLFQIQTCLVVFLPPYTAWESSIFQSTDTAGDHARNLPRETESQNTVCRDGQATILRARSLIAGLKMINTRQGTFLLLFLRSWTQLE